MRRANHLWHRVHSFEALRTATLRAARGKRRSRATLAFLDRWEPECLRLGRALESGSWRPSRTKTFEIHDPKRRRITAVTFRDRVVHHALLAPLQPVFERRMIYDSYACRAGKGTHSAIRRAQVFLRRHRFSLRMDVRAFFDSLQPSIVLSTIEHSVKDRRVLELCERILEVRTIGLPIGSLTSQWFANLTLDRLDHLVKERLRIPGYLRYMDDFVLFADSKGQLRDAHASVRNYLDTELSLTLKASATRLAPVSEGLPFLGFSIFRGTIRLRPATKRRFRWRLRWLRRELSRGHIDLDHYERALAAMIAHVRHADTRGLTRSWFHDRRDPQDQDLPDHPLTPNRDL
ncbi:MAG: reverse transcriptase/maturase family protein [Planctomycetota bacterium]